MSTHNVCFYGEIRKISTIFWLKKLPSLELWVNMLIGLQKDLLSV